MTDILHCPRCSETMIFDKALDFWKCPRCDGEWWEDTSKLQHLEREARYKKMEFDLREQLRWTIGAEPTMVLPLVPIVDKSARGSRSSGKSRKKPPSRRRYIMD